MSDLTFALLIVGVCAAPILLPLLGLAVHRVHARVASPRPRRPVAYDERDLLHTDPREWVRQAERVVEAEQGPIEPHAPIARWLRSIDASLTKLSGAVHDAHVGIADSLSRVDPPEES